MCKPTSLCKEHVHSQGNTHAAVPQTSPNSILREDGAAAGQGGQVSPSLSPWPRGRHGLRDDLVQLGQGRQAGKKEGKAGPGLGELRHSLAPHSRGVQTGSAASRGKV